MRNAARKVSSTLAMLALMVGGMGCAFGEIRWDDPMGHLLSLEETQEYYSQLVRFGDYQTAARFVDPELREDFLERNDYTLRFTDMQSGLIDLDDSHQNSTVTVVYMGYEQSELIERKYTETQQWFRTPPMNDWYVRPYIEGIEEAPPERVVADASTSATEHAEHNDFEPAP